MKPFTHCPSCGGGHLSPKSVEKVVRGGNNTACVVVSALVCLDCGERLYPADTIKKLEDVRTHLEREEVAEYQPIGRTYMVA